VDALRRAVVRVSRSWRGLGPEQRMCAVAALVLFVTMLLPWYSLGNGGKLGCATTHDVSAFGVFSFVEAAVLLVSAGVLALMFFRGEKRGFHLPGGDGTVVLAAGAWSGLLLFYRVLDRPPGNNCPVGIEWGFFLAFVAAGLLGTAGVRLRAAHRPEPPLPAPPAPPPPSESPTQRVRRPPAEDEPPIPGQMSFDEAETQRLRDR
jgi:hypothetical protein